MKLRGYPLFISGNFDIFGCLILQQLYKSEFDSQTKYIVRGNMDILHIQQFFIFLKCRNRDVRDLFMQNFLHILKKLIKNVSKNYQIQFLMLPIFDVMCFINIFHFLLFQKKQGSKSHF